MAEDSRTAIEGVALDRDDILGRNRHAEQRFLSKRRTPSQALIRRVRLGECTRGIVAQERANVAIHALDLVKTRLRGRARGNLAPRELGGEFGDRQSVRHAARRESVQRRRKRQNQTGYPGAPAPLPASSPWNFSPREMY